MESNKNIIQTIEISRIKTNKEVKGPVLVLGYLGMFLMLIGIIVLIPLLMLIFYHDPEELAQYYYFLIPGGVSLVVGAVLYSLIFRRPKGKLTTLEQLILVVAVWLLAIVVASVPFFFYGYDFNQSIFESASGYTATGLTTLNWNMDLVTQNHAHLLFFHRAFSQLVGGVGLVLVLSSAVQGGNSIYVLEGHSDQLLPNLVKTARMTFGIYLAFITLGTLLYWAVGVDPFDGFCFSTAAVATGGFSTRAGSVNQLVSEVSVNGTWRGVMVEWISCLLMILGASNFFIHYNIIFKRNFKVLHHYEYWVVLAMILVLYPFMVIGITNYYNGDVLLGFRYGTFEFVNALSTTGFNAVDSYVGHSLNGTWIVFPTYVLFTITTITNIGAMAGSTAGGIKQTRIGLIFYDLWLRIRNSAKKPESVYVPKVYKYGVKTRVSDADFKEAHTYALMYILIVFVCATIMTVYCNMTGMKNPTDGTSFTFLQNMFEFSAAISGTGGSIGIVNNTTPAFILWIEIFGMLLGRLEIFIFFILGGKLFEYFRHRKHIYHEEETEVKPKNDVWEKTTQD